MLDLTAIQGLIGSLQTAGNIAKAMVSLHDIVVVQSKTIELQSAILGAQSSALAAQSEQSSLVQRIRELEEKVTSMEGWNAEKERYQLTDLGNGRFTYRLKEQSNSSEPIHDLCANCYSRSEKSILQSEMRGFGGYHFFVCHNCNAELNKSSNPGPTGPRPKVITKR